jgi:hypothetical protein
MKCLERLWNLLYNFVLSILKPFMYNNNNSLALVLEQTTATERPLLVGVVSVNFLQIEGCHMVTVADSCPKPLLFLPSGSSIVLEAEWILFQTHYLS